MNNFGPLNAALLFLYEKRSTFHDPLELNKVFFEYSTEQVNSVSILEHLIMDGYVFKEIRTNLTGVTSYVYCISHAGKGFIESLPQEYQDSPYGYHNKLEQVEEAKKSELDRLNLEKLKYDVKNSKRIFRTYWYTFGIAVTGLIISIVLLILKMLGK